MAPEDHTMLQKGNSAQKSPKSKWEKRGLRCPLPAFFIWLTDISKVRKFHLTPNRFSRKSQFILMRQNTARPQEKEKKDEVARISDLMLKHDIKKTSQSNWAVLKRWLCSQDYNSDVFTHAMFYQQIHLLKSTCSVWT